MEQFDRIRSLTPRKINQKIDTQTANKIQHVISSGKQAVESRLAELNKEWDIDRVLMLNFSVLVFLQLLAARKDKKWLWGPLIQTPFLFMHATLGWCPPSLWFRPMGFRTRQEISSERDELVRYLENGKARSIH